MTAHALEIDYYPRTHVLGLRLDSVTVDRTSHVDVLVTSPDFIGFLSAQQHLESDQLVCPYLKVLCPCLTSGSTKCLKWSANWEDRCH